MFANIEINFNFQRLRADAIETIFPLSNVKILNVYYFITILLLKKNICFIYLFEHFSKDRSMHMTVCNNALIRELNF